jgi:hypothetical protein
MFMVDLSVDWLDDPDAGFITGLAQAAASSVPWKRCGIIHYMCDAVAISVADREVDQRATVSGRDADWQAGTARGRPGNLGRRGVLPAASSQTAAVDLRPESRKNTQSL